jgi:anti-sigma-K factor RskA
MSERDNHASEQLAAYALGSLDAAEAAPVQAHLDVCPACRAEYQGYAAAAARLALAAPEIEPPDGLLDRLHERIREADLSTGPVPSGLFSRLSELARRIAPVWTPVSLVLIAVLLAGNLILASGALAPRQTAIRTVNLAGTADSPGASGLITISADGDEGALIVYGLPALDAAHQYQLWLIEDGERDNGGVFSVEADGFGYIGIWSARSLYEYDGFGVTIEPAGGSPGPTGPKVLGSDA